MLPAEPHAAPAADPPQRAAGSDSPPGTAVADIKQLAGDLLTQLAAIRAELDAWRTSTADLDHHTAGQMNATNQFGGY